MYRNRLHLSVSTIGVRHMITVVGPVDLVGAVALDAALRRTRAPAREVLVDVSRVSFLADAGLSVILDARRWLAAYGGELVLIGPGRRIRRLLQITGRDLLLHVEPGVESPTAQANR
jgi:anti-anti-sigma factor